eukprot:3105789-Rhodomonas_salina.1
MQLGAPEVLADQPQMNARRQLFPCAPPLAHFAHTAPVRRRRQLRQPEPEVETQHRSVSIRPDFQTKALARWCLKRDTLWKGHAEHQDGRRPGRPHRLPADGALERIGGRVKRSDERSLCRSDHVRGLGARKLCRLRAPACQHPHTPTQH